MTALEDRLTQELRQLAEVAQPETIRPLGGPARRSRAAAPGRLYLAWARRSRLLAPVAATVAVVAVAVGLGVVASSLSQPGGRTAPTASALARSNAIPPYYATVAGPSDHGLKTFVAVYNSATGARVARLSLPTVYFRDGRISAISLPDITAARNGRTFVLLSAPFPFPDNREGSFGYATRMFRLQVSDSGAVHVTQLPFHVPSDAFISSQDIDLSPDGTRLAIASDWDCGKTRCARTGIQVLNLTTGAVTGSWSTHGGIGEVDNLSWVNARSLAFEWVPLIQRRRPDHLSAHYPRVQALSGAATVRRTRHRPAGRQRACRLIGRPATRLQHRSHGPCHPGWADRRHFAGDSPLARPRSRGPDRGTGCAHRPTRAHSV